MAAFFFVQEVVKANLSVLSRWGVPKRGVSDRSPYCLNWVDFESRAEVSQAYLEANETAGDPDMAMTATRGSAQLTQDLTIQVEKLTAAGCTVVREEKVSGTSRNGRNELETLLAFLRPGDTLMVTKVDRLARSVGDLQDIVKALRTRGVSLEVTDQPIDTSTAAGKAFLDMLGVFAEFETNLRRDRQMDGINKAKAKGVYRGRRPTISAEAGQAAQERGSGR